MSNLQERIRELDTYVQLGSSDPGYVNPATIYVALDSVNFAEKPFKYSFEDLLGSTHIESGRLIGLAARVVSVVFGSPFSTTPITELIKVYRYYEVSSGKWIRQDVQYFLPSSSWVTTTGFSIEIESSESLTGVIVEYKFSEA